MHISAVAMAINAMSLTFIQIGIISAKKSFDNTFCIFEQQLIILSIMYKENEGFARLPPLNHCQEGVKCICRKFSFFIERATLWE